MSHIVNECPLTKYPGGLQALPVADEDAIKWLHKKNKYASRNGQVELTWVA